MENLFADILVRLSEANIKYVIAGGVASVLYGVERLTFDIDLALEMSDENLENFTKLVKDLEFIPRAPVKIDFLRDQNKIKDAVENKNALVFTIFDPKLPIKQIDIFLTKENSYQELIKESITIEIRNKQIKLVSIKKLIEMKNKAGRDKDISDIIELKKILDER